MVAQTMPVRSYDITARRISVILLMCDHHQTFYSYSLRWGYEPIEFQGQYIVGQRSRSKEAFMSFARSELHPGFSPHVYCL